MSRADLKAIDLAFTSFDYESDLLRALCCDTVMPDDDAVSEELASSVFATALIQLTEWRKRYSFTGTDSEFTARVVNWHKAGLITLEDVCVFAERGKVSLKDVFTRLWPNYYAEKRLSGAAAYEVIDVWWVEHFVSAFDTVIARPASENAAEEARVKTMFAEFDETWGPYRPLRARPDEIPINGFPKVLRDVILEAAKYSEVGRDMVTGIALGSLGAAVMGTLRVEMTNGHNEPLNPAILVLADSGGRKSATFDKIVGPLREINNGFSEKDEFATKKRKLEIEKLDDEIKSRSSKKKEDPATAKKSVAALAKEADELDELKLRKMTLESKPKKWDFLTGNATPEAVGLQISRAWSCAVTMLSSDTNIFSQAKDLYGGSGDKQDIYLEAISGSSYVNKRVTGDTSYSFPFSALSLLVMWQNTRYSDFVKKHPDFMASGFISRLCLIYSEPKAGYMTYAMYEFSAAIEEAWRSVLTRINNTAIEHIEAGIKEQALANAERAIPKDDDHVMFRTIKTRESGEKPFLDWIRAREVHRREGEEHSAISSWASKSNNRALVFAALLTLVDDPRAEYVNDAYIQTGIDIENALTKHALFAAETTTEDRARQVKDIFETLSEEMREKHGHEAGFRPGVIPAEEFKKKIINVYWAKMSESKGGAVAAAKPYLDLLQHYGHIRVLEEKTSTGRGRPKKFWQVRPKGL